MRKTLTALLSLCLLFSLCICASADVIWEPYGDSFYDEHRSEMQYEDRFYRASDDLDYYKEPNGKVIGDSKIYADEQFNVQYLYEDENGTFWGNCYVPDEDSVWVNLNGCLRIYDRKDFDRDYADEFVALETQPDASFYAEEVPLYDYPGAESVLYNMTVEQDAAYLPEYAHTYTDEAGNVWAELYYYMGMKGWVLLDGDIGTAAKPAKAQDILIGKVKDELPENDPTDEQSDPIGENITDNEASEPVSEAPTVEKTGTAQILLPVLLVAAVVAVTLAVLFIFFRKKRQ